MYRIYSSVLSKKVRSAGELFRNLEFFMFKNFAISNAYFQDSSLKMSGTHSSGGDKENGQNGSDRANADMNGTGAGKNGLDTNLYSRQMYVWLLSKSDKKAKCYTH